MTLASIQSVLSSVAQLLQRQLQRQIRPCLSLVQHTPLSPRLTEQRPGTLQWLTRLKFICPSSPLTNSLTTTQSHFLLLPCTSLLMTPHFISISNNPLKCLHLLVPLCRMLLPCGPNSSGYLFKYHLSWLSFLILSLTCQPTLTLFASFFLLLYYLLPTIITCILFS